MSFSSGPEILVSPVTKEHGHPACGLSARRDGLVRLLDWRAGSGRGRGESGRAHRADSAESARRSILPLGPAIEYARQAADPRRAAHLPGANGDFNLL